MAKILLIDDDSEFLDMINLLMRREGHQTVLSADGPDGLAKALADPPDLAVPDRLRRTLQLTGKLPFDLVTR